MGSGRIWGPVGGSNAIPAFSNSGTLHLGYRGLFYSECCILFGVVVLDYCIKQLHLSQTWEKLFHDLPWMQGSRSLTTALNSSALAEQGGGMCCCPNATLAQSSGIQQMPLESSTLLFPKPGYIGWDSECAPSSFNSQPCWAWAREAARGERFVHGVPSCSAVTKGIMCFNRLLVFYPPPTCVTSGCWRQMAQCSGTFGSVCWIWKLTLTKEIPWSFQELMCFSLK